MATLRRQNPLDSQGARTPMNSERRMDLIQLITRTDGSRVTTISRSPGRREPSPQGDHSGVISTSSEGANVRAI